MNYNDFCDQMENYVKEAVDLDRFSVRLSHVQKNNGIDYAGISIIEKGGCIGPTIYLEGLYEDYKRSVSFKDLTDRVLAVFNEHKNVKFDVPLDFYFDYEQVKNRLIFKVVNFEKNKDLLEQIPYERVMDLAIIFCCIVNIDNEGGSTIIVRNEHLAMWKVTKDEVFEMAKNNTPILLPARIRKMDELLELDFESLGIPSIMLVMSNNKMLFGAGTIFYDGVLQEIAQMKNSNLYVLPSSVHEVIVIATRDYDDIESLKAMVVDVNATGVEPEDVLSDSVYVYNKSTEELSLV